MKKIDKTISTIKMACIVAGLILAPLAVFVGCAESQVASNEHNHEGHNHNHADADGEEAL